MERSHLTVTHAKVDAAEAEQRWKAVAQVITRPLKQMQDVPTRTGSTSITDFARSGSATWEVNMTRFFQWLHHYIFGHPPPRCPHLDHGESCYKHDTVAAGKKVLAGIFAPLLAILWAVDFGNLAGKIKDAQIRSDYGLEVAIGGLAALWFVSFLWTTDAKSTSFRGYIMVGLAVPFSILSVFTPLIF